MGRQERAERTRSAILDAAASTFDERGYDGTTLSDILSRAELTKGALYFHFGSKRDLAAALMQEQFAFWDDAHVDDVGLGTIIDLSFALASRLQSDVRVRASIRLVIEQGTFSNPSRSAYERWIAVTQQALNGAARHGDLRVEVDQRAAAEFIVASFTGVQLSSQVLADRADLQQRLRVMWHTILPGLVPRRRLDRVLAAVDEMSGPRER